jgi:hypothetical protein
MVEFNKATYAALLNDAARTDYMSACFGEDQAAKDAAVA